MKALTSYSDNVFINCPFDRDYDSIFEAIVFTVHACGFIARCAKEYQDSDDIRIEKIFGIIQECKYGIHDLSRTDLTGKSLPRYNMPLELGIFMGCKRFGITGQKEKKYIVLDSEPHRYRQFISDISGQDILEHNNRFDEAIKKVRNWLASTSRRKSIPGASHIIKLYQEFTSQLPEMCEISKWSVEEITFPEFSSLVTEWLTDSQQNLNRALQNGKMDLINKS